MVDELARLSRAPDKGRGDSGDSIGEHKSRSFDHGGFGHQDRLIIATGYKVRTGNGTPHAEEQRVLGAEPHRLLHPYDSLVSFSSADLRPAAEQPSPRRVRIECKRTLNRGICQLEVEGKIEESKPPRAKGDGIVSPDLDGTLGQPQDFGGLGCVVPRPSSRFSQHVATCRKAMSRGKIRVQLCRLMQMSERVIVGLL